MRCVHCASPLLVDGACFTCGCRADVPPEALSGLAGFEPTALVDGRSAQRDETPKTGESTVCLACGMPNPTGRNRCLGCGDKLFGDLESVIHGI